MLVDVPSRDNAAKAREGSFDSRMCPIAGSVPLQQLNNTVIGAFVN